MKASLLLSGYQMNLVIAVLSSSLSKEYLIQPIAVRANRLHQRKRLTYASLTLAFRSLSDDHVQVMVTFD